MARSGVSSSTKTLTSGRGACRRSTSRSQFSGSLDFSTGGAAGLVTAYTSGLSRDIASLVTQPIEQRIAQAQAQQVHYGIAWQEARQGRPGNLGFELHESVGLASVGILVIFWLWPLVRNREHGISALIPWFSAARRKAVAADLAGHLTALRKGDLPSPAEEAPLASAVHGLGLLVATAMAATGAVVYATMSSAAPR